MGGTVAVTVREPNGTCHRMSRWTNAFPDVVHDMRFINKDPSYMAKYLERWYDMRQDWLDNHETGNFRYNMTPCYGDGNLLAPDGYGLIVLDQKENAVLSMQGYTSLSEVYMASLSLALNENGFSIGPGVTNPIDPFERGELSAQQYLQQLEKRDPDNYAVAFSKLLLDGRVTGVKGRRNKEQEPIDLSNPDLDTVFSLVLNRYAGLVYFTLDLSPYQVKNYSEDLDGMVQMRNDILDLGFTLNEEEEKSWEESIQYEREQYEEED